MLVALVHYAFWLIVIWHIIIDLCFLSFSPAAEFEMLIKIPTNKAKKKIKTQPAIVESKIK